jgi:hypothetical protein
MQMYAAWLLLKLEHLHTHDNIHTLARVTKMKQYKRSVCNTLSRSSSCLCSEKMQLSDSWWEQAHLDCITCLIRASTRPTTCSHGHKIPDTGSIIISIRCSSTASASVTLNGFWRAAGGCLANGLANDLAVGSARASDGTMFVAIFFRRSLVNTVTRAFASQRAVDSCATQAGTPSETTSRSEPRRRFLAAAELASKTSPCSDFVWIACRRRVHAKTCTRLAPFMRVSFAQCLDARWTVASRTAQVIVLQETVSVNLNTLPSGKSAASNPLSNSQCARPFLCLLMRDRVSPSFLASMLLYTGDTKKVTCGVIYYVADAWQSVTLYHNASHCVTLCHIVSHCVTMCHNCITLYPPHMCQMPRYTDTTSGLPPIQNSENK